MRLFFFAALLALLSTGCSSTPKWHNMLVIGDQISAHAPAPELNWPNNWGMGATAEDKDYVHLLYNMLKKESPELTLEIDSIMYKDEMTGWTHLVPNDADLIIVQLSEGYKGRIKPEEYGQAYLQMLRELRGDRKITIVCVGSWSKLELDKPIERAAAEAGAIYVPLRAVRYIPAFRVATKIGAVPNDRGMEKIAEAIFERLNRNQ